MHGAKQMKTLLILGGDRIARSSLRHLKLSPNLLIAIDHSTSLKRVAKLILKKRLSLWLVIKMLVCEYKREKYSVPVSDFPVIKNNKELLELISDSRPERIILFRAGLVINKEVISKNIPLLNIHCAKVPEYGGLGSIDRAIKNRAVEQNATLHQVTTTIDKGEVFDTESFQLDMGEILLC
jgi:formyltetrahydrofolate hydrolase